MNDQSALAHFETFLKTPELPALGSQGRAGRDSIDALEQKLKAAFVVARAPAKNISLIRSLVLLWHDHLDESHTISQNIHTADGSFLHGIMHRREPDYWNSKYWFQRVGNHSAFPEIAARVKLQVPEFADLKAEWDPFVFVDACEKATKHSPADIPVLQRVQEIEFKVLLEKFCR